MNETQRYKRVRNVTLITMLLNILLGVLKIVFGIIGYSHALIADAIHSFSDLITDGLVIFAARFGGQAADHDHPYGHARIETAATVMLAIIVILAGIGIFYDGAMHFFSDGVERKPTTTIWVLLIAFISVVVNEIIYQWTHRVANSIDSNILQANAWHSRSDAASSLIVLLGVAGAMMGFVYLDMIAAMIVGLFILKMGWNLVWSNARELVDTAVDDEIVNLIEKKILSVSDVKAIHQLRTRSMGGKIVLDMHVMVDPQLTVSEGHYIAANVHHILMQDMKSICDVTVHVDVEEDDESELTKKLPSRRQFVEDFKTALQGFPYVDQIETIHLHYITGKLQVDIILPHTVLAQGADCNQLAADYQSAVKDLPHIDKLRLLFSVAKTWR